VIAFRLLLLAGGLTAAAMLVPVDSGAQASATRFQVVEVGDSTVTFATAQARWVRRGMHGIAVDPMRRDELVARLIVLESRPGQAVALITGQTARLNGEHVVLVQRPSTPFYRQRNFWVGAVLGAAIGVAASQ
jgi:hypothetical protein